MQADPPQLPWLPNQLDRIVFDQLDAVVCEDLPITLIVRKARLSCALAVASSAMGSAGSLPK